MGQRAELVSMVWYLEQERERENLYDVPISSRPIGRKKELLYVDKCMN